MFDKLKYNNLLISGGKVIQKAKIQVLRKIIQKIQKLKQISDKKPDDESFKIKLRKCLLVVESAKKIKKFEILTNILLLEKSPNTIVTNSRSTPEEVAIAMLASNPLMKALLTKIRIELGINDENLPAWRKTLKQISKQKVKTQRRKKRKQALEASGEKKPVKKDAKLKKETKKGQTTINEPEAVLTTNIEESDGEETATAKEIETPKKKTKLKKIKQETIIADTTADHTSNESETNKSKKPKTEKSLVANKSKTSENFISLSNGLQNNTKEHKPQRNSKTENFFNTSESKATESFTRKARKISQPEIKISKVVDPFFMTSNGESYVATVAEIEGNNEETIETNYNRKEKRSFSNEKVKSFKPQNEKLHPSWVAKQKERAPVGFQGKRKVFNDEAGKSKSNDESAGDMHPSWIAKQKLKPTITAFQGKKIKFDDA